MKTTHTPGPWFAVTLRNEQGKEFYRVKAPNALEVICDTETIENAKLIAAAPDLLEALQEAFVQALPEENPDLYAKMLRAISKATE